MVLPLEPACPCTGYSSCTRSGRSQVWVLFLLRQHTFPCPRLPIFFDIGGTPAHLLCSNLGIPDIPWLPSYHMPILSLLLTVLFPAQTCIRLSRHPSYNS